jgi:hypothetical protein
VAPKVMTAKTFQNRGGLFTRLHALRMCLKDDGAIICGHDSLAKRLCQVSPYAGRIEPLIGLIPEIMERNDQLRPLWTAWRQNATPDLTPRQYFTRREIKLLCDFVEYLYFASDAFARSARTGR